MQRLVRSFTDRSGRRGTLPVCGLIIIVFRLGAKEQIHNMKKIIIAIDGHSSCGKSTMAKALARKIGYRHIDSGAMYRAVTLYCLRHNLFLADGRVDKEALAKVIGSLEITFRNNAEGKSETYLNGENVERDIRTIEVSEKVSPVSAIGFVREAMTRQQQAMGREKGIIMDGRDIGTAVFPDAELKIFVTASAETRAQRRYDEMVAKGEQADYQRILENVRQRDIIDSTREISPLRKADDALELDNSNMTIEEQDRWLLDRYEEAAGK